MRKRNSFARIGTLCVALLISLGAMGTAYGVWSDTVNITATVETGTFTANLSCVGECDTSPPNAAETSISCSVTDNVLEATVTVTVNDDQVNISSSCPFNIENNGTIPFKIQSIDISDDLPAGVEVEMQDVAEGDQIDSGDTKAGSVDIEIPAGSVNFSFTVTISVVQWNQYIP